MDETPTYIDMITNRTYDVSGKKSIEINHTGHLKHRFTVVLTIAANGYRLPTYLILRKLKKPPKQLATNNNIIVNVSDSGFMDSILMEDYINRVLIPYISNNKCLLVLDDFAAHKTNQIISYMHAVNIKPYLIPGGYTFCLQPLDVTINKPFKDLLRRQWKIWNENSDRYTKSGNKSKPTWQETISMVDIATKQITTKNITNSFVQCGFYFNGNFCEYKMKLNNQLKSIIINENDWNEEIKLFDLFNSLPVYSITDFHQNEIANIPLSLFGSSEEDDELDEEYATIDAVVASNLKVIEEQKVLTNASIQDSIESVVKGLEQVTVDDEDILIL